MKLTHKHSNEEVGNYILDCQKTGHVHQVAYSTYHNAVTQICFTCNEVRTSITNSAKNDSKSWVIESITLIPAAFDGWEQQINWDRKKINEIVAVINDLKEKLEGKD